MLDEVERNGVCVVPGYWPHENCEMARAEVDRVIADYPEYVHPTAKSDRRVYGADRVSSTIREFNADPDLTAIATRYNHESTRAAFTLGARLPFTEGNKGSGEGWHRDAFLRQFKAIIYLADAKPENGPFQMLRDSHRPKQILQDMKVAGLHYMQYRIPNDQVNMLIEASPERLMTFTGAAGTLLLIDTSTIHRGSPIKAGVRYALTNYFYPEDRVDNAMYEKFQVVPEQ